MTSCTVQKITFSYHAWYPKIFFGWLVPGLAIVQWQPSIIACYLCDFIGQEVSKYPCKRLSVTCDPQKINTMVFVKEMVT